MYLDVDITGLYLDMVNTSLNLDVVNSDLYLGTCSDVLNNCPEYSQTACQGVYLDWAKANCAYYCGLCGKFGFSLVCSILISTQDCTIKEILEGLGFCKYLIEHLASCC